MLNITTDMVNYHIYQIVAGFYEFIFLSLAAGPVQENTHRRYSFGNCSQFMIAKNTVAVEESFCAKRRLGSFCRLSKLV